MTRHHNQCFVKLSQLTDNKQEPTHGHNIHSTYNANSTLHLYNALILRPHAWVGCYFDSALTLRAVFNTLTAQTTALSCGALLTCMRQNEYVSDASFLALAE